MLPNELTIESLRQSLDMLPPEPDKVRVHAHPDDIAKGLLSFLERRVASYSSLLSLAGIPVYADTKYSPGTAALYNDTRGTVTLFDLPEKGGTL